MEAKILNINIIMKMGFDDCVPRTIIFLTRCRVQDSTICILFPTHRMSKDWAKETITNHVCLVLTSNSNEPDNCAGVAAFHALNT